MLKSRLIEISVFQAIADLFRNPPPSFSNQPSWDRPWTIYSETDLRAKRNTGKPYLYLLAMDGRSLDLMLPALVIDIGTDVAHFAMGLGENTTGKIQVLTVHCLGTDRGMSKDFGSFIAENLRNIPVYDYNHPLGGATVATVLDTRAAVAGVLPAPRFPVISYLSFDPSIRQGRVQIPAKERFQGMILGAQLLQFRFVSYF